MPEFYHPRAVDDDAATPPSAVTVGGETVRVTGGTFHATEADVRPLADAYDVALSDLRVADTCDEVKADGEVCGRDRPCPYHD